MAIKTALLRRSYNKSLAARVTKSGDARPGSLATSCWKRPAAIPLNVSTP